MPNFSRLILIDMVDGQEVEFPCGLKTIAVTPKENTASFDLSYADGSGCFGIKVPFSYDYPLVLSSEMDNKLKVTAHGAVHLIYTT